MSDTTLDNTSLVEEITTPVEKPQTVKLKTNHLIYTGRAGKIFIILLTNALLMIPTLGIYRFWAKTKLRRYITGNMHLGNDPFEYSGTGKELFIGFLKILPLIIVLSIPYIILNSGGTPATWSIALFLASMPIIWYFVFAGMYASIRYRANRTKWRGIRGHLKGSAFSYANLCMVRLILNLVSFGLLKPSSDIKKHTYVMDNMYFGTQKAEYYGDTQGLYKAYMPMYMVTIGLIILFAFSGGIDSYKYIMGIQDKQAKIEAQFDKDVDTTEMTPYERQIALSQYKQYPVELENGEIIEPKASKAEQEKALGFLKNLGFFYLYILLILPVLLAIYQAAFLRKKMENLKLAHIRFKSKITAWNLIKLRLGNFFILMLTLGFGRCFLINRNMKFFARNTMIGGDLNKFSTDQIEQSKLGHGEEMADFLDADLGIDFGFAG